MKQTSYLKTTSHLALAAAAGLVLGGLSLTPAKAADLGGNCCADLEERVAELEATTARKGTRRVSLEVYGQVNRLLLVWDDGVDSDGYVVDNAHSSTRVGFQGSAAIKEGWKAGYKIEFEFRDAASSNVNQVDDEGGLEDGAANTIRIRQAYWYIDSKKLGRLSVGQQSPATDDIIIINLAGNAAWVTGDTLYNQGFFVRAKTTTPLVTNGPRLQGTGRTWGDLFGSTKDTNRSDGIRYDTPEFYGFVFSAFWGENDLWDAAIWFKKEWNSIRVAFGIGYVVNDELIQFDPATGTVTPGVAKFREAEEWKGSGSIMHIPTGLYVHGAFGTREYERRFRNVATGDAVVKDFDEDASWWYAQLGISKKWLSYGATTIYADYGEYNDFATGLSAAGLQLNLNGAADDDVIIGNDVTRWGFGISQTFDAAAFDLYAVFQHFEADIKAADVNPNGTLGVTGSRDLEDFWLAALGGRIKF